MIRRATILDAPELARLLTQLGHSTSTSQIETMWASWAAEGNAAFVHEENLGAIAGMITTHQMKVLHRPHPVGRITALIVDEPVRGTGIGRALVTAAEAALAAAGCGLLEITSNLKRTDAHAFYERLGYERTSVRLAKSLASAV